MLKYKFGFPAIIAVAASLILFFAAGDQAVAGPLQEPTETCTTITEADIVDNFTNDIQTNCQYDDPLTGREVWRMTMDGTLGCQNFMGDDAGEASSWSLDGQFITYHKRCWSNTPKTSGIYKMDVNTGEETFLVVQDGSPWGQPIFTHDGEHILYSEKTSGESNYKYTIRSISIDSTEDNPIPPKDVLYFNNLGDVLLITRNTGGPPYLYAVHPRGDGIDPNINNSSMPVLFSIDESDQDEPIGQELQGWEWMGAGRDLVDDADNSIWHPTEPDQLWAIRKADTDVDADAGVWDIADRDNDGQPDLLYSPEPRPGHGTWHPNGNIFARDNATIWERLPNDSGGRSSRKRLEGSGYQLIEDGSSDTGERWISTEASPHPYFNPADALIDGDPWNARILFDFDRTPTGERGPFLYVMPINVLEHTHAPMNLFDSEPEYYSEGADTTGSPYIYVTHASEISNVHTNIPDGEGGFEVVGHNQAHPHPHFSPAGDYIIWQSDSRTGAYSPFGTFNGSSPCGFDSQPWGPASTNGGTDIYIAKFDNSHFEPGTDEFTIEAECGQVSGEEIRGADSVTLSNSNDWVKMQFVARYNVNNNDETYRIIVRRTDNNSGLPTIALVKIDPDGESNPIPVTTCDIHGNIRTCEMQAGVYELTVTGVEASGDVELDRISVMKTGPGGPSLPIHGSVDCDDDLDSIDGLFILQYVVAYRSDYGGCPLEDSLTQLDAASGDINGDGQTNVIDALFILQCTVGITDSGYCPATD